MKVMSIFGTRPEMIKLWSTLRRLDELNFEHVMVHTGQNFTPELKDFFFSDLELREPDFQLDVDTSGYAAEVADVIMKSDEVMEKVRPDALLILGDTYSGLSVLPATNRGIRVFHMEAGMRAWDVRMPEQRNRLLIDHLSSVLLPYNRYHRENLLRENIHPSKIFVTGNPTFEVMRHFASRVDESDILQGLGLGHGDHIVVSAHRKENVDDPATLAAILEALGRLRARFGKEIVFPVHPRTRSRLSAGAALDGVRLIEPLGFYDYNKLLKTAFCIVSDSGTSPEEAYIYKVPCVSLRSTTERPETVEGGAHIIAGLSPENIVESVEQAVAGRFCGRYELEDEDGFSPSAVVTNLIRSRLQHHF